MKRKMVWAIQADNGQRIILGPTKRDEFGPITPDKLATTAKLIRIAQFK